MVDYKSHRSIVVRRPHHNVIEYTVTIHCPLYGDQTRVWHANRTATFFGPYTGNPARQVLGWASTLWRETDHDLALAFGSGADKTLHNFSIEPHA